MKARWKDNREPDDLEELPPRPQRSLRERVEKKEAVPQQDCEQQQTVREGGVRLGLARSTVRARGPDMLQPLRECVVEGGTDRGWHTTEAVLRSSC